MDLSLQISNKLLHAHIIKIQAHHSRSMTDNHCSKYMKENVYSALTESVVVHTKSLTESQSIIMDAETIEYRFKRLNAKYSKMHDLIALSNPIPQEEIPTIKEAFYSYLESSSLDRFGRIFRNSIPSYKALSQLDSCHPIMVSRVSRM